LTRMAQAAARRQPPVRVQLLNATPPVAELLRLTRLTDAFAETGGGR
jgi:hypothetical protein